MTLLECPSCLKEINDGDLEKTEVHPGDYPNSPPDYGLECPSCGKVTGEFDWEEADIASQRDAITQIICDMLPMWRDTDYLRIKARDLLAIADCVDQGDPITNGNVGLCGKYRRPYLGIGSGQ